MNHLLLHFITHELNKRFLHADHSFKLHSQHNKHKLMLKLYV